MPLSRSGAAVTRLLPILVSGVALRVDLGQRDPSL
jgi:hypothetical protein